VEREWKIGASTAIDILNRFDCPFSVISISRFHFDGSFSVILTSRFCHFDRREKS